MYSTLMKNILKCCCCFLSEDKFFMFLKLTCDICPRGQNLDVDFTPTFMAVLTKHLCGNANSYTHS